MRKHGGLENPFRSLHGRKGCLPGAAEQEAAAMKVVLKRDNADRSEV